MTILRFTTVDVFTDRQFGGNPLAIVHEADRLTPQQMQAIAAEFNLSETTFVMRPRDPANTAQVRIFTPKAELPFAGHPNVGTAFALAREAERRGRSLASDTLTFEEHVGTVAVDLLRNGEAVAGAVLTAPQPLRVGESMPPAVVANLCGLAASAIEQSRHLPCIVSVGVPFAIARLKDRAALAAAVPRADAFAGSLPPNVAAGLLLYVREPQSDPPIQARVFAPLYGVPEDPATGAANVALIGLLAHLHSRPDVAVKAKIGQGVDMGRPSLLEAKAAKKGGVVTSTQIGGWCVPVMTGTITLP